MSILADIGDAVETEEMVDIVHVHTDSGFYLGDGGLEFVEHLAELGGKVSVPTTMNNTVDPLLVSGPILCKHFYGELIPVVTVSSHEFQLLKAGQHAVVDGNKGVIILSLN